MSVEHVYYINSEDIYGRFTHHQKRAILAIIISVRLLCVFVGIPLIPSIPQISQDLNVTPASVSLAVSISLLASSLGSMLWSESAPFCGRRPVYLLGMPLVALASLSIAEPDTNLTRLLFWQFVQALGCSGSFSLGNAVMKDMYTSKQRKRASRIVRGASLIGSGIAPVIGGLLTQYLSWRGFQIFLGFWAVIESLLLLTFLPETADPVSRGFDERRGIRKPSRWAFLRSPTILAVTLTSTLAAVTQCVLCIPIAYTIGAKYGIRCEGLIGALFLPYGFGDLVGLSLSERYSTVAERRAKAQSGRVRIPEDRAVWLAGLVLVPISVTLAGLTTTYVGGFIGLVINLGCLFANGVGVKMVTTLIGRYAVDNMPSQGAQVRGTAPDALRLLLLAPAAALVMPSVQIFGVAATSCITGMLALLGYLLIRFTVRYRDETCNSRTSGRQW